MSCSPEAGIVDPGDPGCLFLLTRYGSGMSAGIGYPGTGDPEPAVRARNLWPGADRERACNAGRSEVLAAGSLRLLRLPGRFGHLCLSCQPGNCTCSLSTTSVDRRGPPSMPRAELDIHGLRSWGRKWYRKVRETRSSSSQKRPERGQEVLAAR